MADYHNIDTNYLNREKKYYPFDFLSSDSWNNRIYLLYRRLYDAHRLNPDNIFTIIINEILLVDLLIAEAKKKYNIGSGEYTILINRPLKFPGRNVRFKLTYSVFFDLEHPKPILAHVHAIIP